MSFRKVFVKIKILLKIRISSNQVVKKILVLQRSRLFFYKRKGPFPHSTVILKEYFENIPLKSCNFAKIFIKLLERFLKYCRNLAMSVQNIINGILLQSEKSPKVSTKYILLCCMAIFIFIFIYFFLFLQRMSLKNSLRVDSRYKNTDSIL